MPQSRFCMSSHCLWFFMYCFSLAGKPKLATEPLHTTSRQICALMKTALGPRTLFPVFCLNTVKCFLLAGSNSHALENSCSAANFDQLTLYSSSSEHPNRTQRGLCNNWFGRASLLGRWQSWLLYDQADLCKEMRTPRRPICQVICLYSETGNISCYMLMDWRTNTVLESKIYIWITQLVVNDYSTWYSYPPSQHWADLPSLASAKQVGKEGQWFIYQKMQHNLELNYNQKPGACFRLVVK